MHQKRITALTEELVRLLFNALQGALWIMRLFVDIQDILYARNNSTSSFGGMPVHCQRRGVL